jgi:small-conductance mechanosensitive channel
MELNWGRIGLGVLVLFITIALIWGLFELFRKIRCLKRVVSRHNHVFQLILSILFFIGILISVYLGLGINMVSSLLSGVGIALGLALQPIMKKMVAGVVFDTTVHSGCEIICGEFEGRVCQVGMVHTWIELDDKKGKACIHNDYFNTHPITIKPTSTACNLTPLSLDPLPLKYW